LGSQLPALEQLAADDTMERTTKAHEHAASCRVRGQARTAILVTRICA
jgi:hypothetical protein